MPLRFPDPAEADADGLVAIGGDLHPETILAAYRQGIFPWFSAEDPILWWSPDPRFVLFPDELKVHRSMRPLLNRRAFHFRTNTAFETVMRGCAATPRTGQSGTWITNDMVEAYTALHRMGYAHSAEAWQAGTLVGGLYGVLIGRVFFGESMFAHARDASKYAFILWVEELKRRGVTLIDCQQETPHLSSLGARPVPRPVFLDLLQEAIA